MIHTKIAPEYKDCHFVNEFVGRLPIFFGNEGTLLYGKRNTIKSFLVDGLQLPFQRLVVKKFRKPNLFQRFAYSFFCDSKAMRAFNNAAELRTRMINTPQEIAYIEEYQNRLLKTSYVITAFTDGRPIRDFFMIPEGFNKKVAEEFARFVVELHGKGILHHDLNSTNVLYHQTEQGNYFSVIDINRMKIKSSGRLLTSKECFENLTRFTGSMDLFEYVLRYYIGYRKWDRCMINEAIRIKIEHDRRWACRKAFFNKLKKISHV